MTKLLIALQNMINESEEGQGLAEYGLILALVAVVCVVAVTALGTSISGTLTRIAGSI